MRRTTVFSSSRVLDIRVFAGTGKVCKLDQYLFAGCIDAFGKWA